MSAFESLNRDTNPSVQASYYTCPITGTKNITISLNFKETNTNSNVLKLQTLTTANLVQLNSSSLASAKPTESYCNWNHTVPVVALTTEQLKVLSGNINQIPALTTADIKTLTENTISRHSYLDEVISPYNWCDKWYSDDYKNNSGLNAGQYNPHFWGDTWSSEKDKLSCAQNKLNYALESLNSATQKQKKQEILKQIQSLLEKLTE
jgi:hypothetical protein